MNKRKKPIRDHFWGNVLLTQSGCWEWSGSKIDGYGTIRIDSKNVYAHRFAYQDLRGPIPDYRPGWYEFDHVVCSNRGCVRPDHLQLVLHKQNSLRTDIGPISANAKKTHCEFGHEFTKRKTIKRASRDCLVCSRMRAKKYYLDNKEKCNAINKAYQIKNNIKIKEYQKAYRENPVNKLKRKAREANV